MATYTDILTAMDGYRQIYEYEACAESEVCCCDYARIKALAILGRACFRHVEIHTSLPINLPTTLDYITAAWYRYFEIPINDPILDINNPLKCCKSTAFTFDRKVETTQEGETVTYVRIGAFYPNRQTFILECRFILDNPPRDIFTVDGFGMNIFYHNGVNGGGGPNTPSNCNFSRTVPSINIDLFNDGWHVLTPGSRAIQEWQNLMCNDCSEVASLLTVCKCQKQAADFARFGAESAISYIRFNGGALSSNFLATPPFGIRLYRDIETNTNPDTIRQFLDETHFADLKTIAKVIGIQIPECLCKYWFKFQAYMTDLDGIWFSFELYPRTPNARAFIARGYLPGEAFFWDPLGSPGSYLEVLMSFGPYTANTGVPFCVNENVPGLPNPINFTTIPGFVKYTDRTVEYDCTTKPTYNFLPIYRWGECCPQNMKCYDEAVYVKPVNFNDQLQFFIPAPDSNQFPDYRQTLTTVYLCKCGSNYEFPQPIGQVSWSDGDIGYAIVSIPNKGSYNLTNGCYYMCMRTNNPSQGKYCSELINIDYHCDTRVIRISNSGSAFGYPYGVPAFTGLNQIFRLGIRLRNETFPSTTVINETSLGYTNIIYSRVKKAFLMETDFFDSHTHEILARALKHDDFFLQVENNPLQYEKYVSGSEYEISWGNENPIYHLAQAKTTLVTTPFLGFNNNC
jgi:hypothetical protein